MTDDTPSPTPKFDYTLPVSRLLDIGEPGAMDDLEWPDYPACFQLAAQDIPELARMAADPRLYALDIEDRPAWAHVHAWRALGQLKAVAAVPTLLTLFRRVEEEDDEWVLEELPRVMEKIGPPSVPQLAAYLADLANPLWARITAANALEQVGNRHPEARADCVAAISSALQAYRDTDPELNAMFIYALARLKAVEAAPLVEQAFLAERVDEFVMGGWEDFQVEVGLLDERTTFPDYDDDLVITAPYEDRLPGQGRHKASTPEEKKAKKKLKQARAMRKKNRKKK